MAEPVKRKERVIALLAEWIPERNPEDVEEAFFELDDLHDEGLLDESFTRKVKEVLNANDNLKYKALQLFIIKPVLAAQGYWWYDVKNW